MSRSTSVDVRMEEIPASGVARRPSASSQTTLESYRGAQDHNQADEESHNSDDEGSLPLGVRVEAHRDLSWTDVAALIINKTVGTGIFTGPYVALQYTQNKNVVIVLWLLGFLYTVSSMLLYLEYVRDLPYTGGELVYLDHVIPRPRLLAYTFYTFYFVFLYTSCTNCLQFAHQVLIAVNRKNLNQDEINRDALRLIAVCIISVICLMLYFSTSKSQLMNKITAALKLLLLTAAVISGGIYIGKHGPATDFSATPAPTSSITMDKNNWTRALLTVLFSYHGWENATLVAGEIPRYNTLRLGFIVAVFTVGVFYLLVITIYCFAFPWAKINSELGHNYLPTFFGGSDGAEVAAAILIALSAVGSMISVSYTCVRVKQTIGWTGILPWSTIWRRSAPLRSKYTPLSSDENASLQGDDRPVLRKGTPEGGLILHWLVTVIEIGIGAAVSSTDAAISVTGQLLVYGHFAVSIIVGPAFFWFKPGTAGRCPPPLWNAPKPPKWIYTGPTSWLAKGFLGGVPFAFGVVIIIAGPVTKDNRFTLYALICLLATAMLYWTLFVYPRTSTKIYDSAGFAFKESVHGIDDTTSLERLCDMCDEFNQPEAHRHAQEGYLYYNELVVQNDKSSARFLYRFFGGSESTYYPDIRLDSLDLRRFIPRRRRPAPA